MSVDQHQNFSRSCSEKFSPLVTRYGFRNPEVENLGRECYVRYHKGNRTVSIAYEPGTQWATMASRDSLQHDKAKLRLFALCTLYARSLSGTRSASAVSQCRYKCLKGLFYRAVASPLFPSLFPFVVPLTQVGCSRDGWGGARDGGKGWHFYEMPKTV